ncbi:hypothetical protein RRF57_001175 [Xylaria bambusicola]|uniref:Uncharacterized protein n=1 Tax=Xylaria bambusicola TaxID=326684 RepID=A0AAN7YUR4_9PEZI
MALDLGNCVAKRPAIGIRERGSGHEYSLAKPNPIPRVEERQIYRDAGIHRFCRAEEEPKNHYAAKASAQRFANSIRVERKTPRNSALRLGQPRS